MSRSDEQQQPYLLDPIPCRHREESGQMILRAAGMTPHHRAVILGGGACEEIPLSKLLTIFDSVVLNDVDQTAIDRAVANLSHELRGKLTIQASDLTGATQQGVDSVDRAIADSHTAPEAVERMAAALGVIEPGVLPISGPFDLVICSCVLSQLHVGLSLESAARFARRFPGQGELLRESDAWKAALERAARSMEDRFIANLAEVVADDGLVYLSESAQVCFLQLTPDGRWQTPGTYRMLRTKDLADYVRDRFEIVGHNRWEWVVAAPRTPSDTGRLFDVQALVLKRAARNV